MLAVMSKAAMTLAIVTLCDVSEIDAEMGPGIDPTLAVCGAELRGDVSE